MVSNKLLKNYPVFSSANCPVRTLRLTVKCPCTKRPLCNQVGLHWSVSCWYPCKQHTTMLAMYQHYRACMGSHVMFVTCFSVDRVLLTDHSAVIQGSQ